jgi:2-keto-3-deoxy-L-rhamnonate aldolase RhmA
MRENDVRRALDAGESPIGLMIFEFGTTGLARMARSAGADFVLYDMEHSGWSPETLKVLFETARAAGVTPFARCRDSQRSSVSLTLDLGALGLMIPMVESAEQARQIVDYARYAPVGSRGVAVYYADDIEPEGLPATLAKANREVVLMPQIETVAGVEHVEEIAAVDGVDVLWIGHYDLTTSLGTPGAFWNEAHTAAVQRVFSAAAAVGKPVGSLANDAADARRLLAMGFRVIALGDASVIGGALTSAFADVRAAQR